MVSMRSIHFTRWTQQLQDSGHEVHWFDILNGGYIKELEWVNQHTGWRYKGGDFKGRFFLKKNLPGVHKLFENDVEKTFEKVMNEVQPDVVHSFVMYKCCVPIFPVMQRNSNCKWIYSSWGSDLFYFRDIPEYRSDLERILPHIDYMFNDNKRDHGIAKELGFKGTFLGAFPGGGGFHLESYQKYIEPLPQRRTILVKGYQGRSGKALEVLEAIVALNDLQDYDIVVFGADPEVENAIVENELWKERIHQVHSKQNMLSHIQVIKLMGKSLLYIGNSNSDGMPNTLLEAIIMGAFPIQSNPGGVTEEIITHGLNGLLIQDHTNSQEIKNHIVAALANSSLLEAAFTYNQKLKEKLEYGKIQQQVLHCYNQVAEGL